MSSTSWFVRPLTIYGGGTIFVGGLVGNVLNLCLFWSTRRNPCGFYFMCSSLINSTVLLCGLLTRILSIGFNLDGSRTNLVWCKTRIALTQCLFTMSLTCVSLASVDRFLISCRQDRWRKWSRLNSARYAMLINLIFWLVHAIPSVVLADLIPSASSSPITWTCALTPNRIYSIYSSYVILPIHLGCLPWSVLLLTGLLTYRNTQQLQLTRRRQLLQRQLTRMMLVQIPVIVLSTCPYVIFSEYSIFTSTLSKSLDRRIAENLTSNIVTLLFYVTFAFQFFVFFLSSPSFRQDMRILLLCHRSTAVVQTNQIQPLSTTLQRNTLAHPERH